MCEKFIAHITSSVTDPLTALSARFDVLKTMAAKDNLDLNTLIHQQPFAGAGQCGCGMGGVTIVFVNR